jgi:membrane-associated protein
VRRRAGIAGAAGDGHPRLGPVARMSGLLQIDAASPVSYLIALLLPGLDAVLPVLPGETVVIALGVATAGRYDPGIAALIVLAAAGAFLGDNLAYLCGRRFGPLIERRFFRGERGQRRRAWAEHALNRFGAWIIIACRFLPGGRTAVTLTCGMVGYRRRSFTAATAIAGAIWASYAFSLGRLGGKAFEQRPWAGLLLALAATLLLSVLVEILRRRRRLLRLVRMGGLVRLGGLARLGPLARLELWKRSGWRGRPARWRRPERPAAQADPVDSLAGGRGVTGGQDVTSGEA